MDVWCPMNVTVMWPLMTDCWQVRWLAVTWPAKPTAPSLHSQLELIPADSDLKLPSCELPIKQMLTLQDFSSDPVVVFSLSDLVLSEVPAVSKFFWCCRNYLDRDLGFICGSSEGGNSTFKSFNGLSVFLCYMYSLSCHYDAIYNFLGWSIAQMMLQRLY